MGKLYFENLSPRERDGIRKQYAPSEEFLEGKKPFGFKYTFPSGEQLKARQSNRGQGFVEIERNGKIVFNAADLLPEGWKLITPTYFQKHPNEESLFDYLGNHWQTSSDRKLILLGESKSAQDLLLSLLHEMGHTMNDSEDELVAFDALEDELGRAKDLTYKTLLREERAKDQSKVERRAWAWALTTLRNIARDNEVDMTPLFPSAQDVRNYVHNCLADYRRGYEDIIAKGLDEDFYKDLQQYFDRWQYDKPPQTRP